MLGSLGKLSWGQHHFPKSLCNMQSGTWGRHKCLWPVMHRLWQGTQPAMLDPTQGTGCRNRAEHGGLASRDDLLRYIIQRERNKGLEMSDTGHLQHLCLFINKGRGTASSNMDAQHRSPLIPMIKESQNQLELPRRKHRRLEGIFTANPVQFPSHVQDIFH